MFLEITHAPYNRVINTDCIIGIYRATEGYEVTMSDPNFTFRISDSDFEALKKVLDVHQFPAPPTTPAKVRVF